MATVRELTARFTAQYNGMRSTLRAMSNEMRNFGRDSQRQLDGTNNSFRDLTRALERMQDAMSFEEAEESIQDLNRVISRVQEELRETGQIGEESQRELQEAIEASRDDLIRLGQAGEQAIDGVSQAAGQGSQALQGIENAINDVEQELQGLGSNTQVDELNRDLNNLEENLEDTANEAEEATDQVGGAFEGLRGRLSGLVGFIAGIFAVDQVIDFGKSVIETAADIQALNSQYEQVMGGMKESTDKYLNEMSKAWNKHPNELKTSYTQYVAILKSKGVAEEDAHKQAQAMLSATVDANAFANESMEETTARFMGMVKGEYDSLDTAMINISATMMNDIAVKEYGKKFEELTVAQQEQLKMQEAVRQHTSAGVVGQGAREADSYANNLAMVKNNWAELLEQYGSPLLKVANNALNGINNILEESGPAIDKAKEGFQGFKNGVKATIDFLAPYVMPVVTTIVDFVMSSVAKLKDFWDENGKQIMQAAENVFGGISKLIQFIMPFILSIIRMVWGNIKGVISGALNVIMGALKIFAGLFTGDFSKMWEGVKQLFKGAIEFVWNLINLLMFGRIIGGIKTFIKSAFNSFKSFWDDTLQIFKNLDTSVSNVVSKFLGYLRNAWSGARDNAVNIFTNIKNTISSIWDDIVNGAKALPGKIGNGIKNMAGKAADGVKSLANKLVEGLGKGVNGVIGGVNWVLNKVGVDEKNQLPKWNVPEYKRGTGNHPGGPAIVGDGGQQELIVTPDGKATLSPDTDTLMNLPRGSAVLSGEKTKEFIKSFIPAYKDGDGTSLSDIFSMITNPTKLLGKVLEDRGISLSLPGPFSKAASGIFKKVTSGVTGWLKEKLKDIGGFFSGGTNPSGSVSSWIQQAISITGVPSSWFNALTTIAMKESGGNPRAFNGWDINAKRGTPSMGLMQTIGPTFNAYKLQGLNDILNPVHNAVAAIRYIQSRYGSVFSTPGIASMMRGGPYKGYFEGARVAVKQLAWIAEKGAEYVIPTDGGQRAYQLWQAAGAENGFTKGEASNTTMFPEVINLLRQIERGISRGLNATVIMNEREVGRAVEPFVTEFQNRKTF